jgi:hypothetical protein
LRARRSCGESLRPPDCKDRSPPRAGAKRRRTRRRTRGHYSGYPSRSPSCAPGRHRAAGGRASAAES